VGRLTSPTSPRVVLTGAGSLSALGLADAVALGEALAGGGRPALGAVRAFAVEGSGSRLAGELPEGALEGDLVDRDEARRLSRISRMTVAACRLALRDAGWAGGANGAPLGLVVGTEFGDLRSSQEFADGYLRAGPLGLSAVIFPNTVMNTMAAGAAIAVGARGPSVTLNQATVAGDLAVARAWALLAGGGGAAALAGGVDDLCPILYRTLSALGALSPMAGGPEGCRPFDRSHNGPVRGEGATFVLLETAEGARRRGAQVRAELSGAAWANHPTGRDRVPRAAAGNGSVIGRALERAGLTPEQIGWAYLSGNGDPLLDDWQLERVSAAFGPRRPLLTSLAPLLGDHAGLGALRVAAAAWTAGARRLPGLAFPTGPSRDDCAFAGLPTAPVQGPGLVHGVARGGTEVALVVSPLAEAGP
jgi:3-oxoacyl-[acyl-carrier-protein] synthase II